MPHVVSRRITRPWFSPDGRGPGTVTFYTPVADDGSPLLNTEDMPTVWGFKAEADAWAVIDGNGKKVAP